MFGYVGSLQKERVSPGDVIYIEANSGAVKRVGRCDAYSTEFDLEAEEYVPLPKVRPPVCMLAADDKVLRSTQQYDAILGRFLNCTVAQMA